MRLPLVTIPKKRTPFPAAIRAFSTISAADIKG